MSKRVLLLPGQGIAQFEFLKSLLSKDPSLNHYLQLIDDSLQTSFSSKLLSSNSLEFFTKTSNSQPAIVASSYLTHQYLIKNKNINLITNCDYFAGHSLGEFTSLLFNNYLSFPNCLKLVQKRGLIMESLINDDNYGMITIINQPKNFQELLIELNLLKNVHVANINSQKQIAVVGLSKNLEKTINFLKIEKNFKIKVIKLPVKIPFHSELLKECEIQLEEYFKTIEHNNKFLKPMITNHEFKLTKNSKVAIDLIIKNTSKTVDFLTMCNKLYNDHDVKEFVGIGPGNITKHLEVMKKLNNWDESTIIKLQSID